MDVVDQLTAAQALIERGWTNEEWARDARGEPTDPGSENAVKWCAVGACRAVTPTVAFGEPDPEAIADLTRYLRLAIVQSGDTYCDVHAGDDGITHFNDKLPSDGGQETVVSLFADAIVLARQEAA